MTLLERRYAGAGSATTYTVTLSDRERIMAVLANPAEHGIEVRQAIRVLITAGRSTADPFISWAPETAGLNSKLDGLLDLMNDTLLAVVGEDLHCVHPDVPQFVPQDWSDTLNVRAVEDTDFRLPWLDDL